MHRAPRAQSLHSRHLGVDGRVLLVLAPTEEVTAKSFRNIPEVQVISTGELNAYDVLCNDWIVFPKASLPGNKDGK